MELCKYNRAPGVCVYKNIKLPDASSRKYRKICLMACTYAGISVKIYTMYLWDVHTMEGEEIRNGKCGSRGSIVTSPPPLPRACLKKTELLAFYSRSPETGKRILRHACEWLHDRLRAVGQKNVWNVSITLGEAKVKHVDENRREISKRRFLSLRKRVHELCNKR